MAFSLKKVFKKVCVLGGALMFMSPLVSPVVNATGPTASDYGVKASATVFATIANPSASILFDTVEVVAANNLVYNPNSEGQTLFTSCTFKKNNGTEVILSEAGCTVYYRAVKKGSASIAPSSADDWKTQLSEVKATERGNYELYYYIAGGNDYEDVGKGNGQGD